MARWEPNARERLQAAALELFEERGYDRTTVGDIAARADLTERTFFRYFTDKREVLFSGTDEFEKLIVSGVASAPKTMSPLDVVVAALAASSPFFETRRATARKRQALIAAHADLRERELIKFTRLAGTVVASLRERGVAEPTAALLARTGMTLFQNAYERWIEDGKKRDLAHHMHASLAELRLLTAEPASAKPRRKASSGRAKSA
ncbi:TetR family transcriptional regulator [Sorangium sp. So ce1128]